MQANGEERHLIVNADDFGLTEGINRGIIEAHEHGIVTSASLMVRYPGAEAASESARAHPALSVGLHFEAGEWRYRNGEWYPAYRVIDAGDSALVRSELDRQLAAFEKLNGQAPTHLDSHQHVHQSEPVRSVLQECAERLRVPLRGCGGRITYRGDFYGQTGEGQSLPAGISIAALERMIAAVEPGWTEFGCHPGYADELDSVYRGEREDELRLLCSDEIRAVLERYGVRLCSFRDLPDPLEPSI
jgi:predicted glycoside hydrolase/deacetylase ChbG (UPF0249 family)